MVTPLRVWSCSGGVNAALMIVKVRSGFDLPVQRQRTAHLGTGFPWFLLHKQVTAYWPARKEEGKPKKARGFLHCFQPGFAQCQGIFTLPGAKSLCLCHGHPSCSAYTMVPFLLTRSGWYATLTSIWTSLSARERVTLKQRLLCTLHLCQFWPRISVPSCSVHY